jgi:hypothetical protein
MLFINLSQTPTEILAITKIYGDYTLFIEKTRKPQKEL